MHVVGQRTLGCADQKMRAADRWPRGLAPQGKGGALLGLEGLERVGKKRSFMRSIEGAEPSNQRYSGKLLIARAKVILGAMKTDWDSMAACW